MRSPPSSWRCWGVLVWGFAALQLCANPAPGPLLLTPANGSTNVDPDPTLTWRWIDDLLGNGNFESGLAPWYTGGAYPNVWQVYSTPTNHWATSTLPPLLGASGQLVQDLVIPSDATSATLAWKQRVWSMQPSTVLARQRVLLYENGAALLLLDNATGSEPIYSNHAWVTRSTNLLAYAGRTLQVVVEATALSALAQNLWISDVDDFSFSCEHSTTPQFQLYASTNGVLRTADQVGATTDLSFSSVAFLPQTTYYWRVGSVREGVTNYSATGRFTTAKRALPPLTVLGATDTAVRLRFPTRLYRFYTVQQIDSLDDAGNWHDASRSYSGTGDVLELQVSPSPSPAECGFYRLRISP